MSAIAGKHFYRFKYLRSEHWQNLRLEKLVSVDARCKNCGLRDLSNDVHHLNYRSLFDVTLDDLVVLCRKCHDMVHEALEHYREKIKRPGEEVTWKSTKHALNFIVVGAHVDSEWKGFAAWRKKQKEDAENGRIEAARKAISERKIAREAVAFVPPPKMIRAAFLETKFREGFSNPETRPLFIELRRAGFLEDLNLAYTTAEK